MSEKVKLTKEQAESIEWLRKVHHDSKIVARNAVLRERRKKEDGRQDNGHHRKLFKIGLHELIKALYIGYEVEETFEVGDWIYSKQVEKIIQINDEGSLAGYNTFPTYYRHATPEEIAEEKQRRWWAKHGRDVWELKENDLLYYVDEFKEVEEVSEIGAIMLSSERVYLPLETIKSKYIIVCFAEDRKDINGGDIE